MTSVVGEKILTIIGEVRDDLGRAPIVEGVHNFTTRRNFIPKDLDDPALKWGESNVEWSYTVLAQIESPLAAKPVSVLFKHGGLVPRFHEDHIVFYGRDGRDLPQGASMAAARCRSGARARPGKRSRCRRTLPPAMPDVAGETEQCWHYLAREFVRDIGGETVDPYPTFREGSQYQALIDLIRRNDNWTDVSGSR